MSQPLPRGISEGTRVPGKTSPVKSVNWHFTSRCNYHCTFCCKRNLDGDLTSIDEAERVLNHLIRLGIDKINFVGGEPFCHPLINDLIIMAKRAGFTTSVTTNGSLLTDKRLALLKGYLDWVGLSIDSPSEDVEKTLGRGDGAHVGRAVQIASQIKKFGMKLKINTTVTRLNIAEDMRSFISSISPDRWKVFQFLHVPGQNDAAVPAHSIPNDEFNQYKNRNSKIVLKNGTRDRKSVV
jgi:radical S-adenosyl methionine domain-containing protein 2